MRTLTRFALPFAILAGAPAAGHAAAPQYLDEARCLGVYEATAYIFTSVGGMPISAGDAGSIVGALNDMARTAYTRTIETVIARDDMNDSELSQFRDAHFGNSESIRDSYHEGDISVFDAGQLMLGCNAELGYATTVGAG